MGDFKALLRLVASPCVFQCYIQLLWPSQSEKYIKLILELDTIPV